MQPFYTVKQVAEMFSKTEDTIREWLKDGDVFQGAFKVKDGWYVPASDIKKLVKKNGTASEHAESRQTRSPRQSSGFVNRWK